MSSETEVIEQVRETLGRSDLEVSSGQLLFYDLGFTSMDLLDLIFRLEERFAITIPEGTFLRLVQGDLTDEQLAHKGHLTPEGRARLIALLHDSPPALFPPQVHVQTLPRYCTVGAFARLVDHLVAER